MPRRDGAPFGILGRRRRRPSSRRSGLARTPGEDRSSRVRRDRPASGCGERSPSDLSGRHGSTRMRSERDPQLFGAGAEQSPSRVGPRGRAVARSSRGTVVCRGCILAAVRPRRAAKARAGAPRERVPTPPRRALGREVLLGQRRNPHTAPSKRRKRTTRHDAPGERAADHRVDTASAREASRRGRRAPRRAGPEAGLDHRSAGRHVQLSRFPLWVRSIDAQESTGGEPRRVGPRVARWYGRAGGETAQRHEAGVTGDPTSRRLRRDGVPFRNATDDRISRFQGVFGSPCHRRLLRGAGPRLRRRRFFEAFRVPLAPWTSPPETAARRRGWVTDSTGESIREGQRGPGRPESSRIAPRRSGSVTGTRLAAIERISSDARACLTLAAPAPERRSITCSKSDALPAARACGEAAAAVTGIPAGPNSSRDSAECKTDDGGAWEKRFRGFRVGLDGALRGGRGPTWSMRARVGLLAGNVSAESGLRRPTAAGLDARGPSRSRPDRQIRIHRGPATSICGGRGGRSGPSGRGVFRSKNGGTGGRRPLHRPEEGDTDLAWTP